MHQDFVPNIVSRYKPNIYGRTTLRDFDDVGSIAMVVMRRAPAQSQLFHHQSTILSIPYPTPKYVPFLKPKIFSALKLISNFYGRRPHT